MHCTKCLTLHADNRNACKPLYEIFICCTYARRISAIKLLVHMRQLVQWHSSEYAIVRHCTVLYNPLAVSLSQTQDGFCAFSAGFRSSETMWTTLTITHGDNPRSRDPLYTVVPKKRSSGILQYNAANLQCVVLQFCKNVRRSN